MSNRVQLVALCEDGQHETFIRRFLDRMRPNDRLLRVERLRPAEGIEPRYEPPAPRCQGAERRMGA